MSKVREAAERLRAARESGFGQPVVFKLMAELIQEMGHHHLEMAADLQRLSSGVEAQMKQLLEGVRKLVGEAH